MIYYLNPLILGGNAITLKHRVVLAPLTHVRTTKNTVVFESCEQKIQVHHSKKNKYTRKDIFLLLFFLIKNIK